MSLFDHNKVLLENCKIMEEALLRLSRLGSGGRRNRIACDALMRVNLNKIKLVANDEGEPRVQQ